MKKLIVITAIASGLLFILVPRFILPACGYLGFPAMHCSDTARAEYVVGALLIVIGSATALLRWGPAGVTCAALSIALYVVAFLLPDTFGYCHSSRMPCNYGMVPGIRFLAIIASLIMLGAAVRIVISSRKKGNS